MTEGEMTEGAATGGADTWHLPSIPEAALVRSALNVGFSRRSIRFSILLARTVFPFWVATCSRCVSLGSPFAMSVWAPWMRARARSAR